MYDDMKFELEDKVYLWYPSYKDHPYTDFPRIFSRDEVENMDELLHDEMLEYGVFSAGEVADWNHGDGWEKLPVDCKDCSDYESCDTCSKITGKVFYDVVEVAEEMNEGFEADELSYVSEVYQDIPAYLPPPIDEMARV